MSYVHGRTLIYMPNLYTDNSSQWNLCALVYCMNIYDFSRVCVSRVLVVLCACYDYSFCGPNGRVWPSHVDIDAQNFHCGKLLKIRRQRLVKAYLFPEVVQEILLLSKIEDVEQNGK